MQVKAVIFDMDGLLVDSERLGLTGIHECALLQGYDVPDSLSVQCIGITTKASSELYHSVYPDMDTDRLFEDFWGFMHQKALDGQVPPKQGARTLLEYLKRRGIPAVVASSSSPETIALFMRSVGFLDYFAALHSAKGMPSKPAPDVFLRAAERLGVRPCDCLVLEDSYNGVKAGRAAGMKVCMVPDVLPYREELARYVDFVAEDLEKVIGILEKD